MEINTIPKREIFTANPYITGYNRNFRKNNINDINELYNKYLIYPNHDNILKN